ncbi:MAG: spore protease YyaC [Lachnospiraceae bacterium]|nr:spore protease YyaC [Lachnospiraceae bacterium]MDD7024606.1 spore protease YyaC [Oscillospiraceae bacterium]MDY5539993.1 spore protease YyaC [Lachnospiraceae bacterium]MDY5649333.1 spore protease YyaC [Lachnospiraceae bacterium]
MKENYPSESQTIYYLPGKASYAPALGETLRCMLPFGHSSLIILCIGSPLVSGDRLGPRVGSLLLPHSSEALHVFGTEASPVHALNLGRTLENIRCNYPDTPVVAVDAALSERKYLGHITIGKGPVHPGSGIHKELTGTGDVHITGIVSISGYMEYFILRHTPRSQVERLASVIAQGILSGISHETA